MKINLQQKKFIDEATLQKIIKVGINFGEKLNTIDSKCIDDFSEDKLYLKGEACYKDGYIYRAVVSTQGAWVDSRWTKVGTDDFTELSIDDIKAMLGLTQDQIDYLAKLISDDTIVLDHTWSSSKSYTEIQQALNQAKQYCLTELAKKSTGSFKKASSTAEVTDGNYLYLIMNAVSSKYDIYALVDSNVELLTSVDVNLDEYFTKTEIETDYLKKTDADGKYATIAAVDGKVDKTDFDDHKNDTVAHMTQEEKDKIVTTDIISEYTKTKDEKYQIKNYNNDLKVNNTIEKLEDLLKLVPSGQTWYIPDFNIDQAVTDYGFPEGARPWGTMIITNSISAGHYIIELQSNTNYQFENRWVGETKNGVAGSNQPYQIKWQRLCTTSVADVPRTLITSEDTNITLNTNCVYEVIDGICYVSLWGFKSTATGQHVICASMPKTKIVKQGMCCYGSEGKTGATMFVIDSNNGKLFAEINVTGQPLYGAFSYPVAES